jgi:hypothetical protein
MRIAHKLVLLAGLVGVVAFFLPLFDGAYLGTDRTISSLEMVEGLGELETSADGETRENLKTFNIVILIGFGGAALCLLVGILGLGAFGRGRGLLALLGGLAAVGVWLLLNYAFTEVARRQGTDYRGIGVILLLASGAAGTLGGLIAVMKPERPA